LLFKQLIRAGVYGSYKLSRILTAYSEVLNPAIKLHKTSILQCSIRLTIENGVNNQSFLVSSERIHNLVMIFKILTFKYETLFEKRYKGFVDFLVFMYRVSPVIDPLFLGII